MNQKRAAGFQTTAIRRASRGEIVGANSTVDRARTVYGMSNFALRKTPEELRKAWRSASVEVRTLASDG